MSNYKHILLPADFSSASNAAAKKLIELALADNAKLTILHVVTYVPPAYSSVALPNKFASADHLIDAARKHLEEWCVTQGLTDCDKIVASGSAKRIILQQAKDLAVDLIVIGESEENMVTRAFGSVAGAVVHDGPCDVLVVRS